MRGARFCRLFLAFLAVVLTLFDSTAFAESVSPYRADLSLERVYEVTGRSRTGEDIEAIPTVRIKGRMPRIGFIDARFNTRRNKTWRSSIRRGESETRDDIDPVLLQGSLAVSGSWKRAGRRVMPSAASIIGGELKVTFPGRAKGSRRSRQRIYTVRMRLDGALVITARVSSIPRSVGRRGACGAAVGAAPLSESGVPGVAAAHSEHEHEAVPPIGAADEGAPGTVMAQVVTLSTDADPEWYQKYGDQSNAVIASIINTAEAVYNHHLGLRFRIVRQHVYSDASPYTSSDSGRLLSAFTRNPENASNLGLNPATFHEDVDLKHLFTGKDIDGSVIGIAYIGVVCAVPALSYGITQSYIEAANAGIFAHELGHNFGANHDSSDRGGIMYPSISIPPAERFSDGSIGEISSHISKYGSCISLESMAPRQDEVPGERPSYPGPDGSDISTAVLTARKIRVAGPQGTLVRVSGRLQSALGEPIPGVGIKLMIAGDEAGKTVTSRQGVYKFFLRMDIPRGKKVYVNVETEGGEVFSNFLWLGRTESRNASRARRSHRARSSR